MAPRVKGGASILTTRRDGRELSESAVNRPFREKGRTGFGLMAPAGDLGHPDDDPGKPITTLSAGRSRSGDANSPWSRGPARTRRQRQPLGTSSVPGPGQDAHDMQWLERRRAGGGDQRGRFNRPRRGAGAETPARWPQGQGIPERDRPRPPPPPGPAPGTRAPQADRGPRPPR